MALVMANTGGTQMTAFTYDSLNTNVITKVNTGDFLGQNLNGGTTYVMLFDPTGSKFGLMEATLNGGSYSFNANPTYLDNNGDGFPLDLLHTAIGADTSLAADNTYAMPPNIFDFTASATITEGTLGIGKYAALPNFVTGEENFQLVPINV